MAGITDLDKLLKEIKPEIVGGEFVFCTLPYDKLLKLDIKPIMTFKEKEGTTIIVDKESADKCSFSYENIWAMITLNVHSDLNAVGFLAAITKQLAKESISTNVVSGYYHDHIFVPSNKARNALKVLKSFSR